MSKGIMNNILDEHTETLMLPEAPKYLLIHPDTAFELQEELKQHGRLKYNMVITEFLDMRIIRSYDIPPNEFILT